MRQIEIVEKLEQTGRAIADHSRQVLMGEPADWTVLADHLSAAARLCRSQAVRTPTDIGDSGGR